jgi:transcription elongation factor Elf1
MKRKSGIITCPFCGVRGKSKIEILKMGNLKGSIKIKECSACGWRIKEEMV